MDILKSKFNIKLFLNIIPIKLYFLFKNKNRYDKNIPKTNENRF
tara:strand:+ start:367 stop:498 length:132 start_codon:yes stop_codon:yes gene_type:complete